MVVDVINRSIMLSGCVPAKHQPVHVNKAKRSLFGPVDHQEVMDFLEKEMKQMETEKMAEWNFDFANDKPLAGNYVWEKSADDESSHYAKPYSKPVKTSRTPRKSSMKSNRVLRNRNSSVCTQTTITDYMKISKNTITEVSLKPICKKEVI